MSENLSLKIFMWPGATVEEWKKLPWGFSPSCDVCLQRLTCHEILQNCASGCIRKILWSLAEVGNIVRIQWKPFNFNLKNSNLWVIQSLRLDLARLHRILCIKKLVNSNASSLHEFQTTHHRTSSVVPDKWPDVRTCCLHTRLHRLQSGLRR